MSRATRSTCTRSGGNLPRARVAASGTGDFCLLADEPVEAIKARLEGLGIAVEEGPVERTGARSDLWSIYLRDPDGNLVEVANEVTSLPSNTSG